MRASICSVSLALTALASTARTADAETVTVRVVKNRNPEYVQLDATKPCRMWGVDFLRDDGSVGGMLWNDDKNKLEQAVRDARELDRQLNSMVASTDSLYGRPSAVYCASLSENLVPINADADRAVTAASVGLLSRIRTLLVDIESYGLVFKGVPVPGWILEEWGTTLRGRFRAAVEMKARLLRSTNEDESSLRLPTQRKLAESLVKGLDEEEARFKSVPDSTTHSTGYGWTRHGMQHGDWIGLYDANGRYEAKGLSDGSGRVRSTGRCNMGLTVGIFRAYYRSGAIESEWEPHTDGMGWTEKQWFESGQLREETRHTNLESGHVQRIVRTWDSTGKFIKLTEFLDEVLVSKH